MLFWISEDMFVGNFKKAAICMAAFVERFVLLFLLPFFPFKCLIEQREDDEGQDGWNGKSENDRPGKKHILFF